MAGVIWKQGTDAEFIHELGKDCYYNEAGNTPSAGDPVYRIISRMDIILDGSKYFVLKAVDPNNPIKTFQLPLADKDKLVCIDCIDAITSVWNNVKFDGNMDKIINYIRNDIFTRCDIHNRTVEFSVEDNKFKMNFDNEKTFEVSKT